VLASFSLRYAAVLSAYVDCRGSLGVDSLFGVPPPTPRLITFSDQLCGHLALGSIGIYLVEMHSALLLFSFVQAQAGRDYALHLSTSAGFFAVNMTPGAEGGDRSARSPRRGPRGGQAPAERSRFQSDRRRVRRLENSQCDTTHGPAHGVIKEKLFQVALESESGQTQVHESRLWKRAQRKRAIPAGTAERTARDVVRHRKRLELPRKSCCSCGETPDVAPCSAWPFREPAPGVRLAAKEHSTVDILGALFPGNAGYDPYWIFTNAIDGRSHTILMCSKCRKGLRSTSLALTSLALDSTWSSPPSPRMREMSLYARYS